MKATLGLVLACSMVIYASPSLMGMNSHNLPANDQSSADVPVTDELVGVAKEYFANRDSYRGGKRAYAYQGLYLSKWLQDNQKIHLNSETNSDIYAHIAHRATGAVIPLANDSFLLQLYTPGDGRCFDCSIERDCFGENSNPRNDIRSENIEPLLNILRGEIGTPNFWNVMRKVAPTVIIDENSLRVLEDHVKGIINDEEFRKLYECFGSLQALFIFLSGSPTTKESEIEKKNILNDIRKKNILRQIDEKLEDDNFVQLSQEIAQFLNENDVQNITNISLRDLYNNDRKNLCLLLLFVAYNHPDLSKPIANLMNDITNGREFRDLRECLNILQGNIPTMEESEEEEGSILNNIRQELRDNDQRSQELAQFLNENDVQDITNIENIPSMDLYNNDRNSFYQLLLRIACEHFNLREKIADLVLVLDLNTWCEATCQYLEALNEGYGYSSYYDFVTVQSAGDQKIASGYAAAAIELKKKNVLVFQEETNTISAYNFGGNSPYEIVGLQGNHITGHYSKWVCIDSGHSESVLRLLNEQAKHRAKNTRKIFKSEILTSDPKNLRIKEQERIDLKQSKKTYNRVSQQLQYSSATSKDEQINISLTTPISKSKTYYYSDEEALLQIRTSMIGNKYGSDIPLKKLKKLQQYTINTLVRDRKFMPNIIIWTIRDNMYKLQQLIDWADSNGLNPEKVFGFNPIKKLESYRETANITKKFKTDVPDTDLIYNEWMQILLKGNGILQKCYAKMSGDAYALNTWISFIKEDSKNAAKYLRNNVYYGREWMSWSYFLITGNAHKLETLKRFIDLHDNRSRRKSEKDKCINIAINKEEFDALLESEEQKLKRSNVFAEQSSPLVRLLTLSIQYNQNYNDKITGADVCKVLGELKRQELTKMESYGMILAELPSKHKHAFDIPPTVTETEQ